MWNYVNETNVVNVRAPRDLKSGDGFTLGKIFGVATVDAKSGAVVPALVQGGVTLKRAAGLTLNEGDAVNFDEATQTCVATGGKVVGYCFEGASPDDPAYSWVKLIPSPA